MIKNKKQCDDGIGCGNSCIAKTKVCQKLLAKQGVGVITANTMTKKVTQITVDKELQELAEEFRQSFGGDINTTDEAILHDSIHGASGLGATLEDERIVLNVQNALSGDEVDPEVADRVASIISIIPTDLMIKISSELEKLK